MKEFPFKFKMEKNLGVFVCSHVCDDGLPILYVFHDGEGDWQFMCGGQHADEDLPKLICLGDVVQGDATLNELADLGCNHSAERSAVDDDWAIVDEGEETIRANIAEHGWHIAIVSEGDGEPGFAYSIGMKETLGHPEIVVFGLPGQLMASMINELGGRARNGEPAPVGKRIEGLIEQADCILHPVNKSRYREFFGYGRWCYNGDNFEVLQCFWPGKIDGLFPWEPGSDEYVQSMQPDLRNEK